MSRPEDLEPTEPMARPRRAGRRRSRLPGLLRLAGAIVLLLVGLALGAALAERPGEPEPITVEQQLSQVVLTETVAERTITVTVTARP